MTLLEFFKKNNRCALGFSGGVDSAYLLMRAAHCGADIKPYFVKTSFQTDEECDEAVKLAKRFGTNLCVIETDVLSCEDIVKNDSRRCYYCKKHLFSAIIERALDDGYETVLEGTNFSDDITDRPGFIAISELGVISPLRECGITKEMIRMELKEADFDFWNKPSMACLATRIPTGQRILPEDLIRTEAAEAAMKELGFSDFRVRLFHESARIQLKAEQFADAFRLRCDIYNRLSQYFDNVFLDLKER